MPRLVIGDAAALPGSPCILAGMPIQVRACRIVAMCLLCRLTYSAPRAIDGCPVVQVGVIAVGGKCSKSTHTRSDLNLENLSDDRDRSPVSRSNRVLVTQIR